MTPISMGAFLSTLIGETKLLALWLLFLPYFSPCLWCIVSLGGLKVEVDIPSGLTGPLELDLLSAPLVYEPSLLSNGLIGCSSLD